MIDLRPEMRARAKMHLGSAAYAAESIRALRAAMPDDCKSRLQIMRQICNMQAVRVNYLELAHSYLHRE